MLTMGCRGGGRENYGELYMREREIGEIWPRHVGYPAIRDTELSRNDVCAFLFFPFLYSVLAGNYSYP